jgi:hypothetical protein
MAYATRHTVAGTDLPPSRKLHLLVPLLRFFFQQRCNGSTRESLDPPQMSRMLLSPPLMASYALKDDWSVARTVSHEMVSRAFLRRSDPICVEKSFFIASGRARSLSISQATSASRWRLADNRVKLFCFEEQLPSSFSTDSAAPKAVGSLRCQLSMPCVFLLSILSEVD